MSTNDVVAEHLRYAQSRYEHERRNAQAERDNAIRAALAAGWTHTQIAEVTGLTRGRIGQISTQQKT